MHVHMHACLQYWYVTLIHVYVHTLGMHIMVLYYMHDIVFVCMDKLHACNSIARADLIIITCEQECKCMVYMQHFSNHTMNVTVMLQL